MRSETKKTKKNELMNAKSVIVTYANVGLEKTNTRDPERAWAYTEVMSHSCVPALANEHSF